MIRFNIAATLASLVAILLAVTACESEGSSDGPPMQAVPVSQGGANPLSPAGSEAPSGLPGNLPPGHPPLMGEQAPGGMPAAGSPDFLNAPRMETGGLTWRAPESWVEQPPASRMRLVQWQVGSAQSAGPVECALLRFQGTGGGVQENLSRWVGQFSQPDGSDSAEHAQQFQADVNGLRVTRLEVTGTYAGGSMGPMMGGNVTETPDYALLAAVVETPEGLYFLKCAGPETTVNAERASMLAFLETLSIQ